MRGLGGGAGGVGAGRGAALGGVDAALVTLGDQPLITRRYRRDARPTEAPRRGTGDLRRRPGHPVLLGRGLLDRVGELHGDVGFRDLLEGARVRGVECGRLGDPTDIDTPAALDALR